MTHKEYNGYYNYETWLVKLWMDNEAGTQMYFRDEAERMIESKGEDEAFDCDHVRKLAEFVKDQHEDMLPKLDGFAADLMNAALSEVNWEEIAESLLNDAKEALAD
jgi:hypothetical protein